MKNYILAFTLFLFSITICAQDTTSYKITLNDTVREPNHGTLVSLYVQEDHSFLKNIPDIKCDLSGINYFKLNQSVKKDSVQNQMYLFVGVNKAEQEKYVVVDANNNHDFSDDKLYTFPLPKEPLTRDEKKGKAVGLKITLDSLGNSANIGIDPYNFYEYKYGLPQDELLEFVIIFTDYMAAQAQIEDILVEIYTAASPDLFHKELSDNTFFYLFFEDKDGKSISKHFQIGDSIRVNDKLLKHNKVEHPNIFLEHIGLLADSNTVGALVPVIYVKDRENNNDILINDIIKDKYVFIDFWGSWCAPCIASIPKLQKLYSAVENRDDILMLGIALEDEKDVGALNKIIDSKDIKWLNFWVDKKDYKNIESTIQKLNILAYPTYVIIDKSGRIVYKEESMFKTEEAFDFFLNLIKE